MILSGLELYFGFLSAVALEKVSQLGVRPGWPKGKSFDDPMYLK